MFGLPWWLWVIILIAAIFVVMRSARKGFRRRTRQEFIAVFKETDATIEILEESERQMTDSYDATRILLVPTHLRAGEWIAAAIPDRDTLFLAPLPQDGEWSGVRKVARTPGGTGYRLLDRPLKVGHDGVEVI